MDRKIESLLPLLRDVIGLASDLNRWWLEVTQRIFEQQQRTYDELLRITGGASPFSFLPGMMSFDTI